jgi:hypothetical protein
LYEKELMNAAGHAAIRVQQIARLITRTRRNASLIQESQ